MIQILPVTGLPEVGEGDDLAELVAGHASLADGDIVVVSQKIVSKAEGALADVLPGETRADARRRLARSLAVRVLADTERALVVQTPQGLVCANAGIDASNVPGGRLVLLPEDPDASARRLREGLRARTGADVAVIVADTFGRPWRLGQTDVAIGVAGIAPLRDERGSVDREGVALEVTEIAVADQLAAAADLVRRKAEGVPVVIVRGALVERDEAGAARQLVRAPDEDLFPRGAGALTGPLGRLAESEPAWSAPVAADDVQGVLHVVRALGRAVPGQEEEGPDGPTRFRADGVVLGVLAGLFADRGYEVRLRQSGQPGEAVLVAGRPAGQDG
ncbi:MAG TPA: coenzyme F420-0:L-glutamate ligase [Egibacteraceae bacterium]|nr:coenzyme F420-0:L-glutamate ligase [Egibacteraceae bacterium]